MVSVMAATCNAADSVQDTRNTTVLCCFQTLRASDVTRKELLE